LKNLELLLTTIKIEDLKSYFDQPDDTDEDQILADEIDPTELMLNTRAGPRNREELLSHLPDRKVADRLISRYFASMSPSQRTYLLPNAYNAITYRY
jgi:hypothetical protein